MKVTDVMTQKQALKVTDVLTHPGNRCPDICQVLVSALLLRRSFCSWICPVAALSEIFWKSGYKIFRRNLKAPRWLDIALRGIKYMLMAFFLYSIALAALSAK